MRGCDMRKCTICGDRFTGEEISEWHTDNEDFSLRPFICPDCFDRQERKAPEDQLKDLMEEAVK